MNFGDTFKSPIVWGGGALIGIVLLLKPNEAPAAPQNYVPSTYGNTGALNAAVMGAQVELAKVQAGLGETAYKSDVAKQIGFFQLMKSIDDNNRIVQSQRASANAGVTQSLIQSSTAIIIDQSNNANRLAMSWQETARAKIGADRDVSVARYQYKGQKAAAKAGMIGNIAGAVGNVAKAFAMGA